ncbi:uncharacterized protein LOC142576489 [Dermacentor variabilis]|uniref:uncharacterized protein LOC142576489 n=1 Tax=Dermacentor variabilis TaxID=34621 RepID=UPI003F5C6560
MAENSAGMALTGSGGFAKESMNVMADGSLNCVSVIRMKENDYLLPTAVLCDHSPIIRDIVCVQRGDTIPRIHIKGIDDKTFRVIMEYMRTGHAEINVQNVIDVYHAANSLQITPLETICWNKVFEKEPMERSLPAWIAAKRLNMPSEEKQLFRYITHNFDEISKTESFYELDATQVKEILRADVIKADDELALYKSLMNWIHYDCKARSKYASSLVEAIRFQDMSAAQVEAFRAVKVCPEVQKYFDVSQRIPQAGQKKPDKGREYAQAHKVEAGEGAERLPAPPSQSTAAAAALPKPPVPPMPSYDAGAPRPVPPAEAPIAQQLSATAVHSAPPPHEPPSQPPPQQQQQQQQQPVPVTAPLVLTLEQQAAVLTAESEGKPQSKSESKIGEAAPRKQEQSKEKAEAAEKKPEKQPKGEAKATEGKKDSPSKELRKAAPVSEPSLVPKQLPKTKDGKGYGSPDKKKTDSLERPDAKGDKKGKEKHPGKHSGKHVGKHEADFASKTATSNVAATPSTTMPPTVSDPTSATTFPPSTADSKEKKREGKEKKSKDKKSKSKDKKSKGKSSKEKKKKKGFCPWLSSKSSKSSKSTKEKGVGKSKESTAKEAISRSEAKTTEAGKHKSKKAKKGSSKEGSSRSRSKEKASKTKSSKEKVGKGSKEKADKGSKEKSSKERASKEKHSKEKSSKEKHSKDKQSKEKQQSKEKHHNKDKHGSKEKHSKDKRSKEKLSKDKSTSKEGKKGGSKEKIKKKKHSKDKKPGESKSESVGGGGGGGSHKRDAPVNASRSRKSSAEGPGGGGQTSVSKHDKSKSHERSSHKSPSGSSSHAKSSGKSLSSSTVPKRKPDKDRGRSDLGVAGKKSSSGGGHSVRRKARSANRLSSGGGGSDLSLVVGKTTSRTDRQKRRRRLSKVPHRARSETPHTSDLTSKALEYAAIGDQQLVVALLGGLAADSKGANLESAAIYSFGPRESKWKCVGRMPKPRYGHRAVIHEDYIYVVGGFEVRNDASQLATAACYRFSLARSCWETMGSLRRARCHHGVAVVLGRVYAVGGQSVDEGFMDSVEVYDPDLDRWSEVTPLCCARMAANAVEFRGQMYVVGGLMMVPGHKRKVCIVPDTMCFNPMDDTWHHKASLPLPMCNCSLVAHRGRLLAVGGLVRAPAEASPHQQPMAPIGDVLEYSPANDSWSRLSIMPVRAHSVGLASLGDDIYILGGQLADDAGAATKNAYRYNPVTDRWVTLPPLPMRLSQACAVTVRKHAFK